MPVTRPVTTPAVPTLIVPDPALVHTPPVVASLRFIVPPVHTVSWPLMAAGVGNTSILITANDVAVPQLLVKEYFTVSTPLVIVDTTPPLTVASEPLLRLHTPLPPEAVSDSVVLLPAHIAVAPEITPAFGAQVIVIKIGFM